MKRQFRFLLPLFASPALLTIGSSLLLSPPALVTCIAQEAGDESGAEVLTRGPVHEAFAETIVFKPSKGLVISKAPPAAIEEVPPDQRPDGDNVTWIPGYWAWDDEANEFLWVSGIWRNVPPGRQWMPGDWQGSDGEYQWVSGYWADAEADEVEYLPEPPASVEAGPSSPAPSNESIWISGSWLWNSSRYRWRPGYWDAGQPDWDWVPSHYVWSRHGYIFVDGYWDYDVPRRGCLFAPVRFHQDFYLRPGYRYRPLVVVSTNAFLNHLFLRPRNSHYYFGDYYAPEYRKSGYYSSHTYFSGRHGYDPIFAHQRWLNRSDDRWERKRDEDFRFFRDNREERPPRTLAAFQKFEARPDRIKRGDGPLVTPLAQFVTSKDARVKFKAVNADDRQKFETKGREMRDFRKQLAKTEDAAGPARVKPGKNSKADIAQPEKVKIPRSPVLSKFADTPGRTDGPPKRPKVEVNNDKAGNDPGDPRGRGPRGKNDDNTEPGKPGKEPKTDTVDPNGRKPKVDPGDMPKRNPKTDGTDKPKVDPGDNPRRNPNDSTDKPRRDPRIDPNDKPKVDPGDRPKVDPRRDPGNKPKVDSNDKPGRDPRPKIDPGDAPKRQPRVEPKPDRVEPKRDPVPQPRIEPRQPKIEPRPQPKAEPRPQPKAEPRPQPKAEPRPQPRVEPRPQPRSEPRPQPRVEPRPQPQPQPKPQPPSQPQPDKKDKGDGKKDKRN